MSDKQLTLGSLFDGSGGFPLGGMLAGIRPIFASEIEPFPIRVTTKRFPEMKHLGDVSKVNGADIEPVDIITFGSPCQDMSVAGRRAGLDGDRSSLFHQAIRIIKEMRSATNGKYPRFAVWENVPGAFSSNKGEDFRCVLEEFCKVKDEGADVPSSGKWTQSGEILGADYSIAWRQLDAQYWGVPQRRKRIYLVADFNGKCASEILFKSEGLSGYSKESFRAWQRAAENLEDSIRETDNFNLDSISGGFRPENSMQGSATIGYEEEKAPTLCSRSVPAAVCLEYHPQASDIRVKEADAIQTLTARMGTGGNNVPLIMTPNGPLKPYLLKIRGGREGGGKGALLQEDLSATLNCTNDQTLFMPKAYGICSKESNSMKSDNPNAGIYEADTSKTIDGNGGNPSCNQGGIAVVCVDQGGGKSNVGITEDLSPTLTCTHGGEPVIAIQGSMIGRKPENGPQGDGINEDVSFTLNTVDRHAVAFADVHAILSAAEGPKGPSSQMMKHPEENFVAEPIEEDVIYAIDWETFNCGKNFKRNPGISDDGVNSTLVARGASAVAIPENPIYSSSKASYFTHADEGLANTLVATDYKDPPLVNDQDENGYIVRRLTPVECARLQGFPDWWCDGLETFEPTEEDITYWKDVFETFGNVVGKNGVKTDNQIIKWLKDPYSDAAAYKLWGNGVALPCVYYVLSGIVEFAD